MSIKQMHTLVPMHKETTIKFAGFALYLLFLVWLYYPALTIFFASDDWMFLNFVRRIPLTEFWHYFSPKTIWFYRPLHTLQFGVTWHLAGLNYYVYNIQSLVMCLISIVLVWNLIRMLFGNAVGAIAGILFSVSAAAPDMLLWKSNFGSLHNVIATLTACCCFTTYLRNGARIWYFATLGTAGVNFFTKESSINLPAILGAIWITCYLQKRWAPAQNPKESKETWQKSASVFEITIRAMRDLWVFAAMAVIYAVLHKLLVENVDPRRAPLTDFASPLQAAGQLISSIGYALFRFVYDPIILRHIPSVQNLLVALVISGYILPFIVLAVAIWRKSPLLIFSVTFAAAAMIPVFALEQYFQARYFYLAAVGGCTLLAGCAVPLVRRLPYSDKAQRPLATKFGGYTALIFLMWVFVSSVVDFQQQIGKNRLESVFMEQAFQHIQSKGPSLPQRSIIIIERAPPMFLFTGLGAAEMVEIGTGRPDLFGADPTHYNHYKDSADFARREYRFSIDVLTTRPVLRDVTKELSTTTSLIN